MQSARGAVVAVLAIAGVSAAGSLADEAFDADEMLDAGAPVSERELAGVNGLGVAIDDVTVVDSDGSLIVMGAKNSAAKADASGTINGEISAGVVNAGAVSNVTAQHMRGFNVVQVNTAPNANQIVSQAINVYIVDHGAAKP